MSGFQRFVIVIREKGITGARHSSSWCQCLPVQDLASVPGPCCTFPRYESPIYVVFGLAASEFVGDQENHSL